MRLVKTLEALSVWVDFTAAKCSHLPYALWNAVSELLTLLEKQVEQSVKEVATSAKAVPIASPEDSEWQARIHYITFVHRCNKFV